MYVKFGGALQFFLNYINDCSNYDFVAFYGDGKVSHNFFNHMAILALRHDFYVFF